MTAPSIQLAAGMSTESIASSVHAFEASVGAGPSFAEHLDRAVQSETQPSALRSTTPKPISEATQSPRTQATTARISAPQTKQNSGASSRTNTGGGKTQNSDHSQVQRGERRAPESLHNRYSRLSDSSRNSGRRHAGDEENPANNKNPVARSAALQSDGSSATQPAETSAQPSDVSIPAALLALLQAAQSSAQASAEPNPDNDQDAVQTDSSSIDGAGSAPPYNLFQSLNFSASNAAYQTALTNFQTSASTAQSTSSNTIASASQAISANNDSVLPSASLPQAVSEVSTDSTANAAAVTEPASQAANTSSVASTAAPANQANAAASAAHAVPSTSGQVTMQPALANLIKNLKSDSDASLHAAAKPALEGPATAAKSKAESTAVDLQQAVASATALTNHASSPALSRQASAANPQFLTAGQDSGSPVVSVIQGSTSGWADSSTGDSAGDDASTQPSSAPQGSNGSKSSGSAVEFLPNSAFNNDAVGGVAPMAVHAVAAGTLQSNTGFENGSFKMPEAVPQNFNTAAQEKAFAAWQSVSAQIGRIVNTATLSALQNGTEMRVQLRTDAYGPMDIRATMEGGKVGAAIGVESAEAHNALLSQLPALQQSLNERQVQLDQISVVSSYGQSGTEFGTGSGKQNGDATPSGGYHQQASGSEQVSEPVSAPVTGAWQPATSPGRLSVRA